MNKDVLQGQSIIRYEEGQLIQTTDSYVTEFPLTINVTVRNATVIVAHTYGRTCSWIFSLRGSYI